MKAYYEGAGVTERAQQTNAITTEENLPGFSAETKALRTCVETRRGLKAMRKQAYRLRLSCNEFLTGLLNSKFREQLDGEFEVSVSGIVADDFQSLELFHCEYDVYFLPRNYPDYVGLPSTVMPTAIQIDVLEAEISQLYHSQSVIRGWALTHAAIVEVLEYLDGAGMLKIDALIGDAAFWIERTAKYSNEPGWLTLQKARTTIADRIDEMVAAIRSKVD